MKTGKLRRKAKLIRKPRRSYYWQTRRALSVAHLANRKRHPDQHECQRSDLESRNRARGGALGSKNPVHPNDDVNMCSPLTTLSTAMYIAAAEEWNKLFPQSSKCVMPSSGGGSLRSSKDWPHASSGRHPLTVGQRCRVGPTCSSAISSAKISQNPNCWTSRLAALPGYRTELTTTQVWRTRGKENRGSSGLPLNHIPTVCCAVGPR